MSIKIRRFSPECDSSAKKRRYNFVRNRNVCRIRVHHLRWISLLALRVAVNPLNDSQGWICWSARGVAAVLSAENDVEFVINASDWRESTNEFTYVWEKLWRHLYFLKILVHKHFSPACEKGIWEAGKGHLIIGNYHRRPHPSVQLVLVEAKHKSKDLIGFLN